MASQANVDDVEALVRLRVQLIKFVETVSTAVSDAAADVNRTGHWLELDRTNHWKVELRKRQEKLAQAQEALRMKQLFKGPTGQRQSDVDEMKRVKICKALVEEAERKQVAVSQHKNRLARERVLFQGALARLSDIAHSKGPMAIQELKTLILAVEKYGSITADAISEAGEAATAGASVTRSADVAAAAEPSPELAGIDWDEVRRRAQDARTRVAGVVLVENGALDGGRAVVWRDFLKGTVFVGLPGPLLEPGVDGVPTFRPRECQGMEVEAFVVGIVGLTEIWEVPGDKRLVIEEGRVVASA